MRPRLSLLVGLAMGCCPVVETSESPGGSVVETSESSGGPAACDVYCGSGPGPSTADIAKRCLVTFGELYTVPRMCPAGLVPDGCASLTEFSPGFVSSCTDEDILCCKE